MCAIPAFIMGTSVGERGHTSPSLGVDLDTVGDHPIEAPITCVLTRFGLRSARDLLPTYRDYRRIIREASGMPGLLQSAFLLEPPTACYSLSIWDTLDSIPYFGIAAPSHVAAGNRVFGRLAMNNGRPELWSTKWRLVSVSHNLNWDNFDLRGAVRGMMS
jgi:hypothetical protein